MSQHKMQVVFFRKIAKYKSIFPQKMLSTNIFQVNFLQGKYKRDKFGSATKDGFSNIYLD